MMVGKYCVALLAGAIGFAAVAAEVIVIDAKTGVVTNNPNAIYRIETAEGSGSGIILQGADKTVEIAGLEQAQDVLDAVLMMTSDQILAVGSIAIADVMCGLSVDKYAPGGRVVPALGTELLELRVTRPDGHPLIMNADVILDELDDGRPMNGVLKTGEGMVEFKGSYTVAVTNDAGTMKFYDLSGNSGVIAGGEGSAYAVSSLGDGFPILANRVLELKGTETTFSTVAPTALNGFNIIDGSIAHCIDAEFFDMEIAFDPERYTDTVPDCCSIASNTVGVLKMDGGTLEAKITIGGAQGVDSRGALELVNGARVVNYCSTEGEDIFCRSGYAGISVLDGSEYVAAGQWRGGRNGQFNIVVDGGVFMHTDSAARTSGFSLGGAGSDVSVFVCANGAFDASGVIGDVQVPITGEASSVHGAQISVEGGGRFSSGARSIVSDNHGTLNANEGGALCAGSVRVGLDSLLQFDGGKLIAQKDGASLIAGLAVSQAKGAGIEVPEGLTVSCGSPIVKPQGRGIESIEMPDELAGLRFVGPPSVRISGNGKGATAVCEYDYETRMVTGIKITGRGIGYTSATAKVIYGCGDSAVEIGIPSELITLAPNVSGGLTKSGAGTLELDSVNTYEGETSVAGGTLRVVNAAALPDGLGLDLRGGGVLDLATGHSVICSDLRGDGSGSVINGTLKLSGLAADLEKVKAGIFETLVFTNVEFTADATIRLENATDETLDRSQEYVLYEFADILPERLPRIDPETYAKGLSEAWGVYIDGKKAILRYFGGSIFIYY